MRVDASTPRRAETMGREGLLEERLPARFEEPFLKTYHIRGAQRVSHEGRLASAARKPELIDVAFSSTADALMHRVEDVVRCHLQGRWLRRAGARDEPCVREPPAPRRMALHNQPVSNFYAVEPMQQSKVLYQL